MFTVIITEKGGEQRRMDFDKPEVTIGRVQGNDIILPKGNVSKRHSRIVLKDGKFIIVDLKSTNGTYVNGRKITSPLVLKETDKVYIGDFIITVEEPGAGRADDKPQLGSATPLPPPVVPSGVYEPSGSPPSLVSNPPPVPRRPPLPPPMPSGRRPMPDEDVDLDSDLDAPPPVAAVPPPARPSSAMNAVPAPREPAPQARLPPVARSSDRAPPVAASVGRTTSRDEVPPAAPAAVPAPPPSPAPLAAATAPAAAPGPRLPPSSDGERPRATLKSFDAVKPIAAPDAAAAPRHLELARELHDRVAAQIDLARVPLDRLADEALWQRAETALSDLVEQMEVDGTLPSGVDQDAVVKDALSELLALGPLDDLLADDEVSEILVNRSDRVLVERGGRMAPSEKVFSSEAALAQIVDRLLAPTGQRLDAGSPLVDVRLPGGTRVTAALPPLAVRGLTLTVRKPRKAPATLDELVKGGALSQQMASFLATCVAARRNIFVCGGAAAGKTAFLGALVSLAPLHERVVSVEEVAELALPNEHWIALEARPKTVSYVDVVRAALRMRPDRLIVGEVRGAEALEVLSAFAAGAEGGMAAVGGDGAAAALSRLEALARLAAPEASGRGLRELVAHAAHIVVHVARYADGVRRVAAIAEVTGVQGEAYALRELFQYQVQSHGEGGVRGRFVGAGVVPRFYSELEARGEKADSALFR